MALSNDAKLIYEYLIHNVLPAKQVVTYGNVSIATDVPLGIGGGDVQLALDEINQVRADFEEAGVFHAERVGGIAVFV